uniref:hydroxymethylglutaryl-CoA reductase (NADPH) n=1 Tax=Artemisia annua TaxID=35608 RepID=Q9SWQ3_ARTAN|nr:HMG-CoA reductase [Artemisia annua]
MDLRRKLPPKPPSSTTTKQPSHRSHSPTPIPKASDALPLPLYLTNTFFFTLFFSVAYYLLHRWRDKIRSGTPLHVVTLTELSAIVLLIASFIYLLGFFGIDFVQSFTSRENEQLNNDDHNVVSTNNVLSDRRLVYDYGFDVTGDNDNDNDDDVIVKSVVSGEVNSYSLEASLGDCYRAAKIRKRAVERIVGREVLGLGFEGFDYESILGQCCEMPIGYVQVPVGVAGPLLLNGGEFMVPMATTEGCLVASTNRGCKAICLSGGATAILLKDGMTRAPVVRFATAERASQLKFYLEDGVNFDTLSVVFNKSSRFARLQNIQCSIAGKNLYIRFTCSTGDAMGMNMVSKGVQNVLDFLQNDFPDMDVIGISWKFCSDKKPTAVNWIEGRGKSVVFQAVITKKVVRKSALNPQTCTCRTLTCLRPLLVLLLLVLLVDLMHMLHIVSAVFIATGQDPAQNIESSHCITMMEAVNNGKDLHVNVTMPSIEVGTVGGGTQLASQSACLNLLGVKGACIESPGSNAQLLARIVAGSVLAGELSLMSAISAGQLVKSHMKYNRSSRDMSAIASKV